MIEITGYKQTNYSEFKKLLTDAFETCGKAKIQIAANINVKSPATVSNTLEAEKQMVSDEVLTKVMKSVGLSGFVIWIFGKKYYYIKNK